MCWTVLRMAPGSQRDPMKCQFPQMPHLPSTLSGSGGRKWPVGGWGGPSRAGGSSSRSKSPHAGPCSNGKVSPKLQIYNNTSLYDHNVAGYYTKSFFPRLLKAGKAQVYNCPPPSPASVTHVMAKPITEASEYHNAPCYPVSHIVQHLFGVSQTHLCNRY